MTKIYEALEKARIERMGNESASVISFPPVEKDNQQPSHPVQHIFVSLYQNIINQFPDRKNIIIQFLAAEKGVGLSVIVREFAKALAFSIKKSTVLVDAAGKFPLHSDFFNIKQDYSWEDLPKGASVMSATKQYDGSNLFLTQLSFRQNPVFPISDGEEIDNHINELRRKFDIVLIDAPRTFRREESSVFSLSADGIVIVVESGKTKKQVLEKIKQKILKQDMAIIGVVMNKRKYYIPSFIYNRI